MPSFFTPFTRRMPAARSGLRSPRICRFIGEPPDCCKPHIDGARCKQFVFEMKTVAGDHCFVKGKPRFGTIPTNEIVDGTPIAALRFRRPETYQHCRLDVLQIRETQLGLMPIRFSCSWFSSHGYHLPTGKARNGRIRHHIQFLDTAEVREYHVLSREA